VEECCNNKTNILCCFIDFRKSFETLSITNLWNRLEERKVPFMLRVVAISLYENVFFYLFIFYYYYFFQRMKKLYIP
jgi:hypothetical protein